MYGSYTDMEGSRRHEDHHTTLIAVAWRGIHMPAANGNHLQDVMVIKRLSVHMSIYTLLLMPVLQLGLSRTHSLELMDDARTAYRHRDVLQTTRCCAKRRTVFMRAQGVSIPWPAETHAVGHKILSITQHK